jgi:hypothetical protein
MNLNDMNFDMTNEVATRKTEVEARGKSVLKGLDGMYDENARLLFLFDISGSMTNAVPTADITQRLTRIELVKKLAKQEIQKRFVKYPKSSVSVVPFSGRPITLFDAQNPDNLWPALDSLDTAWSAFLCNACGKMIPAQRYNPGPVPICACSNTPMTLEQADGGTDILAAIRRAMDLCRNKPSPVGIHHIILVTDGEDGNAEHTIATWVPAMKASGVVLDYIHIGNAAYANQGLKDACAALGGEYVAVNSEKDFTEKFIAAAERKMLPPAK